MARVYFVGNASPEAQKLAEVAESALIKGIEQARAGIGFAIFLQQFKKKLKGTDLALFVILPDMALANRCMKILKY